MADGPPDDLDELTDVEEGPADEGKVLAPDELDITESEHVEELEEGRFVVSPDGPPNPKEKYTKESSESNTATGSDAEHREENPENHTQQSEPQRSQQRDRQPQSGRGRQPPTRSQESRQPSRQNQQASRTGGLTEEDVHRWLRQDFEASNSKYAFDVTATFEGSVSQRKMASNDVVTIFESLMLWYAQQVDSNTPVEEILGILLMESNVPVRYPPESIHKLVKSSNLTPEDSIGDLLSELEDGVQF
jgi:hypothetical protein